MKLKYFLIILIIFLAAGIILLEKSGEKLKIINNSENGSVDVYFCPEENCNKIIYNEISAAENIKCAFFELNDELIEKELEKKNASLIMHYENIDDYGLGRYTEGLMHDKFCILDNKKVITGSHNPTNNQNKDNVLIIESALLARNYEKEFDELQKDYYSGKERTRNTRIILNGYELENYFCPQDYCQKQVLEELEKANSSIYFLMYSFTDETIANLLIEKNNSGLDVKGVIESYQDTVHWVYPIINESEIEVVLDNEKTLQHNKIFIIDNTTVITGSFNPTKSANTRNDENIIILRQQNIVDEYVKEFERIYSELK